MSSGSVLFKTCFFERKRSNSLFKWKYIPRRVFSSTVARTPSQHPSISLNGDTWPFIPDTQLVPWFCLVPPCKHICICPFLPSPRLHLWQDPPQPQRRGSSLCFYKSYTETSKRRAITEVSGIVWKRATWSPQKGPDSLSAYACCFSVQRLPSTRHVDTSAPPSGFSMKCGAKCETEVGNRKRAVRGSKS